MGDRYLLTVECPKCRNIEKEVYFAPTCGIKTWTCLGCGKIVDLEELTGITEEDASNKAELEYIIETFKEKMEKK